MVSLNQVYRCNSCGNMMEVVHVGGGKLVCCGSPMEHLVENTVDAAKEKHVPVAERVADGIRVSIGSVPHPMQEEHMIQWVELLEDGKVHRRYLEPGQPPIAEFAVYPQSFTVREYCNLHGLWRAESV